MASANDSKALEAGTYSYLNGADPSNQNEDKLATEDFRTKNTTTPGPPKTTLKFTKMASLRYLFMTLALLSIFIVSLSSAAAVRPKDCHGQTAEEIKFQELLATVSDEALHEVLEEHVSTKYKAGVWREDRTAMSAVHKEDAARATSLIQLARRQNVSMTTEVETVTQPTISTVVVPPSSTNEPEPTTTADLEPTTSADPEPTTSDEPTPSETTTDTPEPTQDPTVSESSLIIPVTSTASPTEAESSITEAESSQTSEPPVSTETPETSQSTEEPTSSSTDAPSTSQTSAEPSATSTSRSESVTPTSEPETTTATSTKAESTSTTVQSTTTAPSSMTTSRATTVRSTTSDEETTTSSEQIESSTTQEVLFTTVKPDGSRSTITSYTVVPAAAEATQDSAADPTFTPEVQDAATSLSGAGLLGFAIVGLTAVMAAF